jgi:hypothetical protein
MDGESTAAVREVIGGTLIESKPLTKIAANRAIFSTKMSPHELCRQVRLIVVVPVGTTRYLEI